MGVLFLPTKRTEKQGARIPDWIAESPEFKQIFLEDWRQPATFLGAHTQLSKFKQAAYAASRTFVRRTRDKVKIVNSAHGKLSIAVALLRLAARRPYQAKPVQELLRKYPQLARLSPGAGSDPPDASKIKEHINGLVAEAATSPANDFEAQLLRKTFPLCDNQHDSVTNPAQDRGKCPAERLKVWLPSLRRKIRVLREKRGAGQQGGEPTDNPLEMAKIAKRYWRKIWAKSPKHMRPHLQTYLGQRRAIQAGLMPRVPDVDTVADIILGTNNSCAGPDGIPFVAYRALAKVVAPIIHTVLQRKGRGVSPNSCVDFYNGKDTKTARGFSFYPPVGGNEGRWDGVLKRKGNGRYRTDTSAPGCLCFVYM